MWHAYCFIVFNCSCDKNACAHETHTHTYDIFRHSTEQLCAQLRHAESENSEKKGTSFAIFNAFSPCGCAALMLHACTSTAMSCADTMWITKYDNKMNNVSLTVNRLHQTDSHLMSLMRFPDGNRNMMLELLCVCSGGGSLWNDYKKIIGIVSY